MGDARQTAPPLPAPPATIHLVGIGGSGMSGLARILQARGYQVTGSDAHDSPTVAGLRTEGIAVAIGHAPEQIGDAALVVRTAAAGETNPEVAAALERDIPVIKRAQLLGLLCAERVCVAVAGTHGKSTTSGMLAQALTVAGEDPSFAIGAVVNDLGTNARPGTGPAFIAEADEYDYSFLSLQPDVAVVTNLEHDHPDLFPTREAVLDAFDQFVAGVRPGGTLIINRDDAGCRDLLARLATRPARVITFGTAPEADWQLGPAAAATGNALVRGPDGQALALRLRVPGRHNRLNAVAALAAGDAIGVDAARLLPGLAAFGGVGRRFEIRGQVDGVTVIDDYAHHPTEIQATIAAGRERYPGARLWAVFQPHTYTRTRQLLQEFAAALARADRVVLAPIYAARETDDLGVSSADLAERIAGPPVSIADSPAAAGAMVADEVSTGDLVLVLGAGDIWQASEVLLARLRERG